MALSQTRDANITDWQSIRSAFIERDKKPSYEELSEEFRVHVKTIYMASADEGWPLQRSRFMDSALVKADVTQNLIELARDRRETTSAVANLVLVGVRKLTAYVEGMPENTKPRAAIDMLGTVFFAASNAAKALKDVGVAQIPKELADGLDGRGGSATKDMLRSALQQINVSVSVAAGKAEVAATPVAAKDEASEVP